MKHISNKDDSEHQQHVSQPCGASALCTWMENPIFFFAIYNVVPQNVSVQLVPKTSIIMVYGRYIELVSGVYKSTFTSLGGTTL